MFTYIKKSAEILFATFVDGLELVSKYTSKVKLDKSSELPNHLSDSVE